MKKTLKIEIINDNGVVKSSKSNDGFSGTELIGLLRMLEMDVIAAMSIEPVKNKKGESCQ